MLVIPCAICGEEIINPTMSSVTCSTKYSRAYRKTEKYKAYQRAYKRAYYQKNKLKT